MNKNLNCIISTQNHSLIHLEYPNCSYHLSSSRIQIYGDKLTIIDICKKMEKYNVEFTTDVKQLFKDKQMVAIKHIFIMNIDKIRSITISFNN